jgi:hypothetical protein
MLRMWEDLNSWPGGNLANSISSKLHVVVHSYLSLLAFAWATGCLGQLATGPLAEPAAFRPRASQVGWRQADMVHELVLNGMLWCTPIYHC